MRHRTIRRRTRRNGSPSPSHAGIGPRAPAGRESGQRPLDFPLDVQPVLDAKCVECHGADKPEADLDLTGTMTPLFSRSYENLVDRGYLIANVGELQPKGGMSTICPPVLSARTTAS
jgi:hypothetical protein